MAIRAGAEEVADFQRRLSCRRRRRRRACYEAASGLAESPASKEFELPWRRRATAASSQSLQLVIVWSLEEPDRIGQSALLVEGAMLGEGSPSTTKRLRVLPFYRLARRAPRAWAGCKPPGFRVSS